MKLLIAALLLASASGLPAELEERLSVEQLEQQAVEYFRHLIKHGDPGLDVPRLDPYIADSTQINFPGELLSFWAELRGAAMTGLGDFHVDHLRLDVRTLRLEYDIRVDKISLRADHYNMFGQIFTVLPLYGEGTGWYDILGLRMLGTAQLARSQNGKSIVIDDITDAVFSLKSVDARTTGHIGGGDIDHVMNAIVSDLVADYTTRFSRYISLVTTDYFESAFNYALVQLETWHLLDLLEPHH